jgi:hypothetical protein
MLYLKVMSSKKTGQISTGIIDDETNTYIEPLDILNKRCYMTGAIKFESVFIGNKISLQIKLFETVVRIIETNVSRGLLRPNAKPKTETLPYQDSIQTSASSDETPALGSTASSVNATTSSNDYTEEIYEEEEEEGDQEGEGEELEGEEGEEEEEAPLPPAVTAAQTVPTQATPVQVVSEKSKTVKTTRGRPKAVAT